ncbi:MAG: hypothetical protein CME88_08755 [Hirschia sp.]|nr:hypothetical protein [Hirschia sp.]
MIDIRKFDTLGRANHGWLDARHHFSFARYHDPARMGFGGIRVINDDLISAHKGFEPHPHRDMEIITYVRRGAITHKDSQGNEGRTAAGDVQVMSAGSGIVHAEYNLEDETTNLYQIWIFPRENGIAPRWGQKEFPKVPVKGTLPVLVSGYDDAPLYINADARIYGGKINEGETISHQLAAPSYLLVSEGEIDLNGNVLSRGDSASITDLDAITIKATSNAEVLVIETGKPSRPH